MDIYDATGAGKGWFYLAGGLLIMKVLLGLAGFMTSIMLATVVALGDNTNNNSNLRELPVDINLRCLERNKVVLEISNPSNKEQKLVSNLRHVLDYLCFDFPAVGALQLRNAAKEQLALKGQGNAGWFYPVIFWSALDFKKSREVETLSDIFIPGGGVLRCPLKYEYAVTFVVHHLADLDLVNMPKTNEPLDVRSLEVRLKLPLLVSTQSGEKVRVPIISEWFLVPADIKYIK